MRCSGEWPGAVTLRQGWGKANARPWNEESTGASLRLERGTADFVQQAADTLESLGATFVATSPLAPTQQGPWTQAGFGPFLTLDVYGRSLMGTTEMPSRSIVEGTDAEFAAAVAIDDAAFEGVWRLGNLGLREALTATPRSAFLVSRHNEEVAGFAIVGHGGMTGYLQRIAVAPAHRGAGHASALVRAGLRWCRDRGATQQVLNTQPGNEAASSLYRSEGYTHRPAALVVLKRGG